jgi:HPt (histidine-containing phosphotransfer) domain-containing protein
MAEPVVAKETILATLDNDTELLREVITLFLEDCPKMLAALRSGVDARDRKSLGSAAHALKGSVSNFGAASAYQAAQKLEKMARQEDWNLLIEISANLERELTRVTTALEQIRKEID